MPMLEERVELWRGGRFVDDEWTYVCDELPIPDDVPAIVSIERFLGERNSLLGRNARLGVTLTAGSDIERIAESLDFVSLVALHFPKYSDGRSYSMARILRDRLGYSGEIRARGDILRDQVGFLLRAGFDALEITDPITLAHLRAGPPYIIRRYYQPSSSQSETVDSGFAWRRKSVAIPGSSP